MRQLGDASDTSGAGALESGREHRAMSLCDACNLKCAAAAFILLLCAGFGPSGFRAADLCGSEERACLHAYPTLPQPYGMGSQVLMSVGSDTST